MPDERQRLVQVGTEFGERAGLAGIIAGGLNAAAGEARVRFFKAAYIVALPAVEGNGNGFEFFEGGFGIDAKRCVGFFCEIVGLLAHRFCGFFVTGVCDPVAMNFRV